MYLFFFFFLPPCCTPGATAHSQQDCWRDYNVSFQSATNLLAFPLSPLSPHSPVPRRCAAPSGPGSPPRPLSKPPLGRPRGRPARQRRRGSRGSPGEGQRCGAGQGRAARASAPAPAAVGRGRTSCPRFAQPLGERCKATGSHPRLPLELGCN